MNLVLVETKDRRVLRDRTHSQADLVKEDHKVPEDHVVQLDSLDHKDHQDPTVKSRLLCYCIVFVVMSLHCNIFMEPFIFKMWMFSPQRNP